MDAVMAPLKGICQSESFCFLLLQEEPSPHFKVYFAKHVLFSSEMVYWTPEHM